MRPNLVLPLLLCLFSVSALAQSGEFVGTVNATQSASEDQIYPLQIEVRRSTTSGTARVHYWTTSSPAGRENMQYVPTQGVLEFAAGQAAGIVSLQLVHDGKWEEAVKITLHLEALTPGYTVSRELVINVCDVDTPVFSFAADEFRAGRADGTYKAKVRVRAEPKRLVPFTIDWKTNIGWQASGTLVVQPDQTEAVIEVPVPPDSTIHAYDPVELRAWSRGSCTDRGPFVSAMLVRVESLPIPTLVASELVVPEGDSGSKDYDIVFKLTTPHTSPLTIVCFAHNVLPYYSFPDGETEYLTFAPGETAKKMRIRVFGDTIPAADRVLFVSASTSSGLPVIGTSSVRITIKNDDAGAAFQPQTQALLVKDEVAWRVHYDTRQNEGQVNARSSNPSVVASPGLVTFRMNTQDVDVPVHALAPGQATITAELSSGGSISGTVTVFATSVSLVNSSALVARPGTTSELRLRATPPPPAPFRLKVRSTDPAVFTTQVPSILFNTDGVATLKLDAIGAGSAMLDVSSSGGAIHDTYPVSVSAAIIAASITPAIGVSAGGTNVTITGQGFVAPCGILFDNAAATNVTIVDAATLTATAPPHAAGNVPVMVTCNGQSASLPGGFTYVPGKRRSTRH
ncbi:MAG TPA: IPT/TIG domain-containing protein [Thermoanaerobaculia bacterium]|jgi:hypothetical protein